MTLAIGVQIGIAAASIALSLLLRPKVDDVEGPRLGDTSVSTSGYGRFIKFGDGTTRSASERIWVKNNRLDEVANSEKIGGKGLGGGGSSTNYSYFGTWADSFGEGPASRARRIWFNSKLVYDLDGAFPQKADLNFRFYSGSDTQQPDPLIASFLDAQFGEGSTPAHRGQCYIVFIDVPLADYGNSLPSVEIELEYGTGGATELVTTTLGIGSFGTSSNSSFAQIDSERRRCYIGDDDIFNGSDAYGVVDLETTTIAGVFQNNFDMAGIDHAGNLFGSRGDEGTNQLREPYSGKLGKEWIIPGNKDDQSLGRGIQLSLAAGLLTEKIYVCKNRDGFFGGDDGRWINFIYSESLDFGKHYASHKPYPLSGPASYFSNIVEAGRGKGVAWVVAHAAQADTVDIWQVRINGPIESPLNPLRNNVQFAKVVSYAPADFDGQGGGVSQTRTDAAYDPTDGTLVSFARLHTPSRTVCYKWSPDLGIVWATTVPGTPEVSAGNSQQSLAGNTFAWFRPESSNIRITMLNLHDGKIIISDLLAPAIINNSDYGLWEDARRTLYTINTPSDVFQATRIGATARPTVTKAAIIARYCDKAGLLPSEYDVTGVSGSIGGWIQANQSGATSALQSFLDAYFIDAFTSGGKLVFKDRGGAVVGTIREADLLADADGVALRPRKIQEQELPETVQVLYRDIDKDHLDGDQSFKRIRLPNAARTIQTRQTLTLSLPVSDTAQAMREIAVKQMAAAWNERDIIDCRADVSFVQYDPGDALLLQREDGTTQRVRIAAMPFGVDLSFEVTLIGEDVTQYAATIQTDAGSYLGQTIAQNGPSKALLLNTTILRDLDATDRTFGRLSWAAAPLAAGGLYTGALLYRLLGDTDFAVLSQVSTAVDWGVVTSVYPATDRPHIVEFGSSLDVVMVRGGEDLATTTLLNMMNGDNAVLIAKEDGRGEVLGFVQVSDLGGGGYRLTDLLHGRRGTEGYMAGVAEGDTVVVLNRSNMSAFAMALSEVGVARDYKVVTSGSFLEFAETINHTYTGDDRKPWAPGQITATEVSSDIAFAWTRRTRHSGEWNDGSGTVPLNEDAEEYEIDILDGPAGAVLRTAAGLTSPAYTYLNADIVTDFGSIPATIDVRVYQISAQVGRGFTNEVQLEVA